MNELLLRSGIGKLLHDAWVRRQHQHAYAEELRQAIEQVVQVADPGIRNANRYQKILLEPIESAMKYCATIIDAIPGPVPLSRKGYNSDPLVKYLFTSAEELEEVIRISPEPQALREQGYVGEVAALLTMTRQERTFFGSEQEGDIVRRDVAQRAVSFVDHQVMSPAASMDTVKRQLVRRGLNILATAAMETITGLKQKKAELREKKEYLNAAIRIMGGKKTVWEQFAPHDPAKLLEITKAEQRLAEVEAELAAVQQQLDGPEDVLGFLKAVVSRPDKEFILQHYTLRLDWKGIRLDGKDEAEGNEISLVELSNSSGEIQRSVVLVTFPMGETAAG